MASAIGTALFSAILQPMAAKAMERVDGIVNIKRDISNLQKTLGMIERTVRVAEEKQIDDDVIRNWLRDLVDIAYEARDVLDDFITFSSCTITAEEASNPVNTICSLMLSCFGVLSSDTSNIPLTVLNRLEKDIRSVTERFDVKIKESEKFNTLRSVVGGGGYESVSVDRRPEVGPYINKQRDSLFLGREKVKEEIMDKILRPSDDRVDVVVIWGMGGIGKTTLAQSIYNDERVKKVPRRWLFVGVNKFSAEKAIREILNDKESTGNENLQTKLKEKFEGNRFLIVLDDVWDVDGCEWDLLFNPLTEVGKGGMIIITRRERQLCDEITSQTAYNLRPLSEKDSWSIFESCAYVNGKADSTSELKPIGEKIVKKLDGHPLALKVVGRSLLKMDSNTWKKFLESKFTKDEVMSALRWSYNHLPRHLKKCFTYCAFFPKDHVFYNEKILVEMWMAHDLIQKEDVGAQYFEELVNASLLQCVDGKHKMHDLIHDLALLVSNGEFATTNSSLTNDQMENVRHITITRDNYSKIPRLWKMEKLLTLYTNDTLYTIDDDQESFLDDDQESFLDDSFLDDVFKKLKSIRVLVLVSSEITKIPDCISELRHLRYLDVSKTEVESLPDSLCHLYNLQMLAAPKYYKSLDYKTLNYESYVELPIDIVNISSLRYVRASLSTCKGVGKLTSLQELSSIHVCEGDNIRELGDMQILRGKLRIEGLENVEKLEDDVGALMDKQTLIDGLVLEFYTQLEKSTISKEVLDALGCPPNLTYLRISGYTGVKSPSWMVDGKQKFDKLQTLKLSNCPKLESLPPLGELTYLKDIFLWNVGVKRLGDEFYGKFRKSKVSFPSLESLSFHEMQEWEKWDDIIIKNSSVSFFPRLTELKITECTKLSVLPVVKNSIMNVAYFMTSLSRLKISNCDGLKRLQLDALVSLKELDISYCDSLVQITSARCESLEISTCILLEKMDVARRDSLVVMKILKLEDCESLRSLSIDIHGMDSLEHLSIHDSPKLELAFEDGSSSSSSSGNSVAVPIHNITTDSTQVFRTLLHHDIVSLESLEIRSLGGFENFDETEANNFCKSRSLKRLLILQCEDLKSLPADLHKISSLKRLNISRCPQLQSLPRDFHKLSSLEELSIFSCPQLQSLPPDFHKLSSLKSLTINSCPQLQSLDFHKLSYLEELFIFSCPQLQSLDFHRLSSLEELFIFSCPQLQSLPPDFHKLSSLEKLRLDNCPQLQSLPPDFHKLSSLEKLRLDDCPQLQSLPADGLPPSLTYLYIIRCPLLYERCKDESGLDWHKINHIHERDIHVGYPWSDYE